MKVVFISGATGSGKSLTAKSLYESDIYGDQDCYVFEADRDTRLSDLLNRVPEGTKKVYVTLPSAFDVVGLVRTGP